jgi:hypothetical protein
METLEEKFPTSLVTWDTLAREDLGQESKGIRGCRNLPQ